MFLVYCIHSSIGDKTLAKVSAQKLERFLRYFCRGLKKAHLRKTPLRFMLPLKTVLFITKI